MAAKGLSVIGVDPGVEGGICVMGPSESVLLLAPFHSHMVESEVVEIVNEAVLTARLYRESVCYFEKVGYKKGDGGKGAFIFGKITGILRGALLAERMKIISVSPVRWMSYLDCLTGGNKNVTKRKAISLYPDTKITHNTADALLIALYGQRRLAAPR